MNWKQQGCRSSETSSRLAWRMIERVLSTVMELRLRLLVPSRRRLIWDYSQWSLICRIEEEVG
jgi:hypothetical protein